MCTDEALDIFNNEFDSFLNDLNNLICLDSKDKFFLLGSLNCMWNTQLHYFHAFLVPIILFKDALILHHHSQ